MPLTLRGAKEVADAMAYYKGQSKPAKLSEPIQIHGHLWKSGRTGARYFKTEPETPLLLYFRSRRLVENNVLAAHAALDLTAASKIAVVAQNGIGTSKFVIQSSNPQEPTLIEHVELTATSPDEARRWVRALLERKSYFAAGGKSAASGGRRPSQQELALAGMALFKRATEDGKVMTAAVRRTSDLNKASDLTRQSLENGQRGSELARRGQDSMGGKRTSEIRKPEMLRLSSTGSTRNDDEVYFSASSDEEEADGEPKSRYITLQQKLESSMEELASFPSSSVPFSMWGRPGFESVPLRGFNYLVDHKKVLATRTLMRLVAVDCFSTGKKRLDHVAAHPQNRMSIHGKAGSLPPFTWVIVFQPPGRPNNFNFVLYYVPSSVAIAKLFDIKNVSDEEARHIADTLGLPPQYHMLLRKFFFGKDDTYRNERFKLVPQIEDGPWLVKNAVPSKPALIGTKLTHRYFLNERYMELDIDIGSSSIANNLTQLSIGYATKIVVNLSFVLEGRDPSELPEEIVGMGSVIHADIAKTATPLAV